MFCVILEICHYTYWNISRLFKISQKVHGDSTRDQYRCYRSLAKYFKKSYINSYKYTYLEQTNLLYEHQYGFRKHMSTLQALLNHIQFM